MSGIDRDTTRIVRSWMEEGATQLPDHVLDAVLDQLPETSQRQSWWLTRRFPQMSTAMRVVLASVAALVVVAGGAYVLSGQNVGAPAATPTPSPTLAPTFTPTPTPDAHEDEIPFADIPLEPGSYSYYEPLGDRELRVILTVPDGWVGHESWYVYRDAILVGGGGVAVAPWLDRVDIVYTDPCQQTTRESVGSTAAELAAAFAATSMNEGFDAVDITVSGYTGKEVRISTDPEMDGDSCTGGNVMPWFGRHVLPGTEQTLWILDVEGSRLVIDASAEPGADASQRADLQQVLESIQIEVN